MRSEKRFVVFSTGHAGSTWLSHLFFTAAGVPTFHEPVTNIVDSKALESIHDGPESNPEQRLRLLKPYLDWLDQRSREYAVFGEIHTGQWELWPLLKDLIPRNRCIVTRHPIQVVHSVTRTSSVTIKYKYRQQLSSNRRILPSDIRISSNDEELFAIACAYWSRQVEVADALAPLPKFRLEDLTNKPEVLRTFIEKRIGVRISLQRCAELGTEVKNRKVPGDRSPENLFWNLWSDSERVLFRRLCGPVMEDFGYSIPPAELAPVKSDLEPNHPTPQQLRDTGSLRPAWVFYANPRPRVVLIYGGGERALAAVDLLSVHETYLVRSRVVDWQEEPSGFRVIGIEDTPVINPKGMFVVHPRPDRGEIRRLCELNPGIEMVEAVTSQPSEEYSRSLSARPDRSATLFRRYGPLETGESLVGGWQIERLWARRDSLEVILADSGKREINIFLKPGPVGRFRPVSRVADGYIEYRSTDIPYKRFAEALKRLSERLAKALDGSTVAEAMSQWYKEAVRASIKTP